MPVAETNNGHKINYEVHGNSDSEHIIIFSHGNGNCLADWHTLGYVDVLARDYRLVLYDALGYGKSDKPSQTAEYTPERRAEDVITVLDTLGIKKAHFFGASIGGSLGFVLTELYPDRFVSFIIGSAHPYGDTQPIGCNLFGPEFRELLAQEGIAGFVTAMEERYLGRRFHEGVRVNYLQNDPQALISANTPEWRDRSSTLSNITVPVLLFAGDQDPVSEYQAEIASHIPNCQVEILKDTDHAEAYWKGVELVAPLIARFLRH